MRHSFSEICTAFTSAEQCIVCCHVSPDPDAIGSAAAMTLLLSAAGKKTYFYLPEPYQGALTEYCEGIEFVHHEQGLPREATIVVLDTATRDRSFVTEGFFSRYEKEQILVLDHHGSNPGWGSINYIDATAAATAQLVFDVAQALNISLTPNIASLLYAGLLDDTGSFRYSNTSVDAFLVAAKLLEAGAQPEVLANALYFSIPERVMRLRTMALTTLQTHADGRIASIAVTQSMLEDCLASVEDSDGLVDVARSLQGVQCALFFRQREEGWRVSLRAKDDQFDVNQIAARFGGGGHRAASGCTITDGTLEEVCDAVVAVAMEQIS